MRYFRKVALLFLFTTAACAQVTRSISLNFDGMMRSYLLHLPKSYEGSKPFPLILDFHGYTNSAAGQRELSGFRFIADADSFLIAWPQGDSNSWNAGGSCCGRALRTNLDDVGFAKAVVKSIRESYAVDGGRVYAMGHSNGGAMVQRLAAEASDVFAAVVGFSGMLLVPAKPQRAIPILNFHGYEDSEVVYLGNTRFPSAPMALKIWAEADSCEGDPDTTILSEPDNQCVIYPQCQDSVSVGLCSIHADHMIYNNTPRLDLKITAWNFLSRFNLKNPPEVTAVGSQRMVRKRAGIKMRTPISSQRYLGRSPE